MNSRYICEKCGNIISIYKNSTKTRRKCSKCGSYHVIPAEEKTYHKDSVKEKFPFVSLIVVNYNGKMYLQDCLDSLGVLNYPKDKYEVILVDNKSSDDSVIFVKKKFPKVKGLQNNENNYCKANNLGITSAQGKFIGLLNNDIKADKNWLIELIDVIQSDNTIGAVGSKVLFEDGKINSTGQVQYPNYYWSDRGFGERDKGQYDKNEVVESLCGVAILYRKECLDNVGLLDEDFIMYCEDIDMALRCKKNGWKIMYVPKSIVYHKYHGSGYILDNKNPDELAKKYVERNRLLLIAKHFPEKLPDALTTSTYFYIEKQYDWLYEALPIALQKAITIHPKNIIEKIIPRVFSNLRKVISFEKDVANIESEFKVELKKKYDETNVLAKKLAKLSTEIEKNKKDISNKDGKINELEKFNEVFKNELKIYREQVEQKIRDMKAEHIRSKIIISNAKSRIQILEKKLALSIKESYLHRKNFQKELMETKNKLDEQHKIRFENMQKKMKDEYDIQMKYMEEKLRETTLSLKQNAEELDRVYNSNIFKLFVSNIWNLQAGIKNIMQKEKYSEAKQYQDIFIHVRNFIEKMIADSPRNQNKTLDLLGEIRLITDGRPNHDNFLKLQQTIMDLIKCLANDDPKEEKRLRYLFSYSTLIPLISPRAISIDISERCNLQCRICNQWKDINNKKKMTIKDLRKIIDQIKQIFPSTLIEFSGQEPLLKKEILFQALQYAKGKNVEVALSSNGTLIDESTAHALIKLNIHHISISLDAASSDIHDYMRNKEGSFEKAIYAIKLLVQIKKEVDSKTIISVTTVITNKNIDELLPVYTLIKKLGVNAINYNAYIPDNSYFFNSSASYNDEFWVKNENISKLKMILERLITIKKKNLKPVIGNSLNQIEKFTAYFEKKQDFSKRMCLAGYNYFHITNFGEVTVCGKGPYLNIRKVPIKDVWVSDNFLRTRLKIKECSKPCINNCFELT